MIVITTMDVLPDYCYDCPCHDSEYGACEADKAKRSTFEYRPYWCPLKEVNNDSRHEKEVSSALTGKDGMMVNKEKVIKGLEICYCPPSKCFSCPYHDLPVEQSCNDVLGSDALALLIEQEKRINELQEKLRLLEYGDLDTLQSAMRPAT